MSVQWTQVLSVGLAPGEKLHRDLLFKMGELLDARSRGEDKEEIGLAVESLADYLVARFAAPRVWDQPCLPIGGFALEPGSPISQAVTGPLVEGMVVSPTGMVLDLHVGYLTSS